MMSGGAITRWLTQPRHEHAALHHLGGHLVDRPAACASTLSCGVLKGSFVARSFTSSTAQNRPQPAHVADRRVLLLERARACCPSISPICARALDEVEPLVLVDGGDRRRQRERVRLVGVAVGEVVVVEVVGDRVGRRDEAERHVRRR